MYGNGVKTGIILKNNTVCGAVHLGKLGALMLWLRLTAAVSRPIIVPP
jgi:hypothetical protein